ncbi:MAG: DNA-processing protein DprA [Lachnospiraceae bacterium]
MQEQDYWIWLSLLKGVGLTSIHRALTHFCDAKAIYMATEKELQPFFRTKQIRTILDKENQISVDILKKQMYKEHINIIPYDSPDYPDRLKYIWEFPLCLYHIGCPIPMDKPAIAIVGARGATPYGLELAYQFSYVLAKAGFCIISGLASGIDAQAHRGALDAGGATIGVLGCGIDVCYPAENYYLYEEMKQKAAVVSEYGKGISPKPGLFPMRNRIISGISMAVLVVEARQKSGSLITAEHGLNQGKDIFAVPGRPGDICSAGCNRLIQMGAQLVTKPEEILETYRDFYYEEKMIHEEKIIHFPLERGEDLVYSCLCFEPKHINIIIEETQLSMADVMVFLYHLVERKLAEEVSQNYYRRKM